MATMIRLSAALVAVTFIASARLGLAASVESSQENSKPELDTLNMIRSNILNLAEFVKKAWTSKKNSDSNLGENEFLDTVLVEIIKFKELTKHKIKEGLMTKDDGVEMNPEALAEKFKLDTTGSARPEGVTEFDNKPVTANLNGSFGSSEELNKHILEVRKQAAVNSFMSRTHELTTSLIGQELRELALLMLGLHSEGPANQQELIADAQRSIAMKVIEYVVRLSMDILSAIFGQPIHIENTGDASKTTKPKGEENLISQNWID